MCFEYIFLFRYSCLSVPEICKVGGGVRRQCALDSLAWLQGSPLRNTFLSSVDITPHSVLGLAPWDLWD